MAQKVTVVLVDDLTGETAAETVEFGLDGVAYTIDLSAENAAALREALSSYVECAKRTGGRTRRNVRPGASGGVSRGAAKMDKDQAKAIRVWARRNGHPELGDRGRIPQLIIDKYNSMTG